MKTNVLKPLLFLMLFSFASPILATPVFVVSPAEQKEAVEKKKKQKKLLKRWLKKAKRNHPLFATISMWAGIAAIGTLFIPFVNFLSPFLAIAGIVFGLISLIRGDWPKVRAVVGLVLSSLYFLTIIIVLFAFAFVFL